MSKINWFSILGFVLIIALAYIGGLGFVYAHEKVHSEIYRTHNITSEISINYFLLSGSTSVLLEDWERCDGLCMMSHDLNESIGYQIEALILNLWLLFGAYIILKEINFWRKLHG